MPGGPAGGGAPPYPPPMPPGFGGAPPMLLPPGGGAVVVSRAVTRRGGGDGFGVGSHEVMYELNFMVRQVLGSAVWYVLHTGVVKQVHSCSLHATGRICRPSLNIQNVCTSTYIRHDAPGKGRRGDERPVGGGSP